MLSDRDYMQRALELAAKARPISPPNPSVGCVIVRDGLVLGEGFTQKTGSDHAEIQAIKNAQANGFSVEGAIVYVTLEPCSHYGRTPPCALRLIKEKVARVVVACLDPNPLVAGRGVSMLREAGIDVTVGLLQQEAWQMNAGFMTRMTEGRPWVRAKVAMSLDGYTALVSGESQWITGPEAREDGRRWRCVASAILTGVGTVLADNPSLTARVDGRLQERQPLKVLLDSALRVNSDNRFFDEGRVLVVCAKMDANKARALQQRGAQVLQLAGSDGRLDLKALLTELARREINEVHVEAGARLTGELVRQGLVDELLCYIAPKILGAGRSAFHLPAVEHLSESEEWTMVESAIVGNDVRMILRKRK